MTPGIRRFIASMLVVLFLTLPGAVLAQEKRGANLIVALKDGPSVAGELIAVRQNSLVLVSPAGKDESIEISRISTITIAKKSKAGSGFLTGFLVGGIAGGVLGSRADEYQGGAILAGVLLFGALGGLIGLGIGAASGGVETIEFAGLSETQKSQVLKRLRGMARMPAAQ